MDWYPDDFEELRRDRRDYVEKLTPDQRWNKRLSCASREINYKARANERCERI